MSETVWWGSLKVGDYVRESCGCEGFVGGHDRQDPTLIILPTVGCGVHSHTYMQMGTWVHGGAPTGVRLDADWIAKDTFTKVEPPSCVAQLRMTAAQEAALGLRVLVTMVPQYERDVSVEAVPWVQRTFDRMTNPQVKEVMELAGEEIERKYLGMMWSQQLMATIEAEVMHVVNDCWGKQFGKTDWMRPSRFPMETDR